MIKPISFQLFQVRIRIVFLVLLILFTIYHSPFTNCYAQDNHQKAREFYLRGDIYYQQGKYKEAQELFQRALDLLTPKEEACEKLALQEATAERAPVAVSKNTSEYIIGEEDILRIMVWQNPDLEQEVIVRPDGKFSFPLIGDIQAGGLTISQLDEEITSRLKEYIRHPEVSISIKKIGGKKVIVLGEVRGPGIYSVTGRQTVLEAIALSGGFTNQAVVSSVILIRGGLDNPQGMRLNLNRSLFKADMNQNPSLQPEDIIFVPKKFVSNVNYLLNEILGPITQGSYNTESIYNKRW